VQRRGRDPGGAVARAIPKLPSELDRDVPLKSQALKRLFSACLRHDFDRADSTGFGHLDAADGHQDFEVLLGPLAGVLADRNDVRRQPRLQDEGADDLAAAHVRRDEPTRVVFDQLDRALAIQRRDRFVDRRLLHRAGEHLVVDATPLE
jgi:hypothetical protein